ncbi:hypothetical protein C1141_17985, partial [Vibrio agarivorans]
NKTLQMLFLLCPSLNSVYAAEASDLFKQELSVYSAHAQQLQSVKNIKSDEVRRYRFTGILNFAEYDSLHLNVGGLIDIIDKFNNLKDLNELFISTNDIMARAELQGSIKIVLPDENVVAEKEIVLWDSSTVYDSAAESVSFLQQYLYNVEFEAKGSLDLQNLTVSCNIVKHGDTVCSGKQVFNLSQVGVNEQMPDVLQDLPPIITPATKLVSGDHRTINTIQDLIDRVSELNLDPDQSMGEIVAMLPVVINLIRDASGVWVTNPSVALISDSQQKNSKQVHRSIKGNYQFINNGEVSRIEPYGQMYVLPSAHVISIADAAQYFADKYSDTPGVSEAINDALETMPDIIKNTQLPFDLVDVEPIQIFDQQFTENGDLRRHYEKNKLHWFAGYSHLVSDMFDGYPEQMVVFSNVWEKDDNLNLDDCLSRGYGFGFEALDFNSLDQQGFTGCGKNDRSEVEIKLTESKLHQPDDKPENYPWELDAQYYFVLGDGGDDAEPYGYAYFELPDGRHQALFRDDYRSASSSDMYFVNDRSFYTYKTKIKFTGPKDWTPSQAFPLLGSIYEADDTSGDDKYYDANDDIFAPTQEQMDVNSAEYGKYGDSCGNNGFHKIIRSANHDQHICVKLTLKPGSEKTDIIP